MTIERRTGQPTDGQQPFGDGKNAPRPAEPQAVHGPPKIHGGGSNSLDDKQRPVEANPRKENENVLDKTSLLSYPDDLRQRMSALGTDDPAVAFLEMMTPRLVALSQRSPKERAALTRQGAVWRAQREKAGLGEEELAAQVGITPIELSAIERGVPPPEGLSRELASRLDSLLAPKPRP